MQNGVVVIPGSSNPDHILKNTKLYDFELTDEEMAEVIQIFLQRNVREVL